MLSIYLGKACTRRSRRERMGRKAWNWMCTYTSHGQKIDKFEGGWTKNRQIFVYRTLREALLNINISTVVRCTQIFTLRESHFSPVG